MNAELSYEQLRERVSDLLKKPPVPSKVETSGAASEFKKIAGKAHTAGTKKVLLGVYTQLQRYYQ